MQIRRGDVRQVLKHHALHDTVECRVLRLVNPSTAEVEIGNVRFLAQVVPVFVVIGLAPERRELGH